MFKAYLHRHCKAQKFEYLLAYRYVFITTDCIIHITRIPNMHSSTVTWPISISMECTSSIWPIWDILVPWIWLITIAVQQASNFPIFVRIHIYNYFSFSFFIVLLYSFFILVLYFEAIGNKILFRSRRLCDTWMRGTDHRTSDRSSATGLLDWQRSCSQTEYPGKTGDFSRF